MRRQGIDGLLPQRRRDRGTLKAFSPELLEASIALRRELPSRSTPTLIAILEMQDRVARGQLRRATLDRHLADAGVARRRLKPLGDKRYIRLLFQRPNQLWVGDYHESIGGIKAIFPAHRPPAPPAPSRTGPARQGAARLARELQAHAPCTTRRSATDGLRQPPGPQGLITERDVAGEIGEVIVGKKPAGRRRRSSPSSTRRGSRCRTRRRCPSSTSARSPPASASKRR